MDNSRTLNAGIVGLGKWGQKLVKSVNQNLSKSNSLNFTHAFSRTFEKVKSFCSEYNLNHCNSFDELLSNDNIDLIVLATPHSIHAEQIIKTAESKKHVFVEKPFTLTLGEAMKSIKACKKFNVKVGVGFNRRFLPSFQLMKQISLNDNFGEKIHIEGNFSGPFGYNYSKSMWRGSLEENPTGGMAAMGIHVIDAMINLLGPIKAVQCISKQQVLKHLDIDDTSSIQLWFSSGATGYLSTLMATAPFWRIQLYGTKAWVTMNGQNETVSNLLNETPKTKIFKNVNIERLELECFADNINGKAEFPVRISEILNGVSTFESIAKSNNKGGQKVFVKDFEKF